MNSENAKSSDFKVGQIVTCRDVARFHASVGKYLASRTGVVTEVTPVRRPDAFYCGHLNSVFVLWGKRNGHGKEKLMRMAPRDLLVVNEKERFS